MRSHLVITIVVAVLICVFSVAAAQAVDPRDKGQVTARRTLKTISPLSPIRHTLATLREALAGLVPARSTGV